MTPTTESIELLEIVDAIADADAVEDAVKVGLLQRIEQEQGIVSTGLRTDVVAVLRAQAEAEETSMKEDEALLRRQKMQSTPSLEDEQEAAAILQEARRGFVSTSKEVEDLVDTVRADVIKMERDASQGQERVRRQTDQQSIERIRKNLASGSGAAA